MNTIRSPFLRNALRALVPAVLLFVALPGCPFVAGEAAGVASPYWPLLFIALVPFVALSGVQGAWFRFIWGVTAGLLLFLLQLYWIVVVLGRYGGLPLPVAVAGLVLLALYMALYSGLFLLAGGWARQKMHPYLLLLFLPSLWVGLDWLRSILFSGFPWMDLGYGLAASPYLLQSAELFGHYGLTFLVVLINVCFFLLTQKEFAVKRIVPAIVAFVALVEVWGYGHVCIERVTAELKNAPKARIGAVQGNIEQQFKWEDGSGEKTVALYLNESRKLFAGVSDASLDLVVWPETALPFYPQRSDLFDRVRVMVRNDSVPLLTGAPWFEIKDAQQRLVDYYNSAVLLRSDGTLGGISYKTHLVPFGEYVPLKKYLPFLAPLVEHVGDFSAGTVGEPLSSDKLRCGVLICFESVFPEIARRWSTHGANLLVNLTNDAWYGNTSAPYQSWSMAVLRAVENRRSLVRSANTGISGFVDPLGRIQAESGIFTTWARAEDVALLDSVSVYVRWGHWFPVICLFAAVAIGIYFRVVRRDGATPDRTQSSRRSGSSPADR